MTEQFLIFFLQHYRKYESNIGSEKINNAILCFGTSGAGKSTFLARLTSPMMNQDDFMRALPKVKKIEGFSETEIVKLGPEEVEVGNSKVSVTIIPRKLRVGEFCILDMPGLMDNNDFRKYTIDILHKCLFNVITEGKFLVVVNSALFQGVRMTALINQYHNKLKELCGAQFYDQHLKQMFFVITHVDKTGVTEGKIDGTVLNMITEFVDTQNTGLMSFLSRIHKNRILVDYTKMTQSEILKKVIDMLDRPGADDQYTALLPNPDIFTGSESALEDCCKKELNKNVQQYTTKHEERCLKAKDSFERVKKYVDEYEKLYQEHYTHSEALQKLKEEILEDDKMIEACKGEYILLKEKLITRKSELNNFREQISFFQKISDESVLLDVWKFKPIRKKRNIKKSSFDFNILLKNDHPTVYILAVEAKDEEFLKQYIKEDGVVTFEILEKIKAVAQQRKTPVLKVLDYERKGFEFKLTAGQDGRKIMIKSFDDFVLYYCFKEAIKNTLIYREMHKLYSSKKGKLEREVKDIETNIKRTTGKQKTTENNRKKRIQEFKENSTKFIFYLKHVEKEYFNVIKDVEVEVTTMEGIQKSHEGAIPKRQLGIIEQVGQILSENRINDTIAGDVKKFKNEIQQHTKDYLRYLEEIAVLKTKIKEHDPDFRIHVYDDMVTSPGCF